MALGHKNGTALDDLTALLAASLTLVVGLAWNSAAEKGIAYIYPQKGDSARAALVYAFTVTCLVSGLFVLGRRARHWEKRWVKAH
jgi:hypothetical protein